MEGVRVRENLPSLSFNSIFFNQRINPEGNKYIGSGKLDGNGIPPDFFDNVNIRKAFSYSFDWGTYIEDAYSGAGIQGKSPIPQGVPYYNPDQETYHYDPERATELFREAYGGRLWDVGFEIRNPYISGTPEYKAALDILAASLRRINPKFTIEPIALSWPTLYSAEQQNMVHWTLVHGPMTIQTQITTFSG